VQHPARHGAILAAVAWDIADTGWGDPVGLNLARVAYKIVDPASLAPGPGPHPAASPFDKRVSETLGLRAFEVYHVELPPEAETVRHNHREDGVEDLYVVLHGHGWVVVDDEPLPVRPGLFIAVTTESARQVRAGDEGLVFIALCAAPRW
ncbi:MAG: cupin domain-containing protein, partial [Ilumatobacteraceae bacterium]